MLGMMMSAIATEDTAQWVTFAAVISGFAVQLYRETRNRRWDREDRERLAKTVVNEADRVAKATTEQVAQLTEDIKANTEISTKAFHEANSVNMKIAAIGAEQVALATQQQAMQDKNNDKDKARS